MDFSIGMMLKLIDDPNWLLLNQKYCIDESNDGTCWIIIGKDTYEGIIISKVTKRVKIHIGRGTIPSDKIMVVLYNLIVDGQLCVAESIGEY